MTQKIKMKRTCRLCGGTEKRTCCVCKGFGHKTNNPIYRMINGYKEEDGPCSCCGGEGKVACFCVASRKAEPKKSQKEPVALFSFLLKQDSGEKF